MFPSSECQIPLVLQSQGHGKEPLCLIPQEDRAQEISIEWVFVQDLDLKLCPLFLACINLGK